MVDVGIFHLYTFSLKTRQMTWTQCQELSHQSINSVLIVAQQFLSHLLLQSVVNTLLLLLSCLFVSFCFAQLTVTLETQSMVFQDFFPCPRDIVSMLVPCAYLQLYL